MKRKTIEIEISGFCNLNCPNCNASKRLRSKDKLVDKNLVAKIIKFFPKNSHLLFSGLGEPTIPDAQKKIIEIMKLRKDLTGYIQTNGSFRLSKEIAELIDQSRLKVGLSYDEHHLEGGLKELKIQKDLIDSISISVKNKKFFNENFFRKIEKEFPNLKRILIDPLYSKDFDSCLTSWEDVEEILIKFSKRFKKVTCYAQLFSDCKFLEGSGYFNKAKKKLIPYKKNSEWFISPKGFLINISRLNDSNHIRILTNGRVMKDLRQLDDSWEEVNATCPLIEEYFAKN